MLTKEIKYTLEISDYGDKLFFGEFDTTAELEEAFNMQPHEHRESNVSIKAYVDKELVSNLKRWQYKDMETLLTLSELAVEKKIEYETN